MAGHITVDLLTLQAAGFPQRRSRAGRTSHLFKRRNDHADTFAKKGADTQKPAFRVAKSRCLPGQASPTSCSGSGAGATPGRPRQERGHVLRGQGSSASDRRRSQRRLQVRCATGFPPWFPHVISTHARSEGTACNWDELSTLGVERWTEPSSAVYWEWADALCRSCSGSPAGRTSQLRKLRSGLFPNKRYPGWTVEHVRRPTLDEATTLVSLARRVWAEPSRGHHTQKATSCPAGSGTRAGRACWRRTGSTISWSPSSPSRPRVLVLARQTDVLATHTVFTVFEARPKPDVGDMCTLGCDGSSASGEEAVPHNFWNSLLSAMVHFRTGDALQLLLTEEEQGGVDLPFCVRRTVRGTQRLGRSRVRLTKPAEGCQSPSLPTPSDVRQKARRCGRLGPR